MTSEACSSTAIEGLDELLKIPLQNQDGKIYNLLSNRKKELFNFFFDKTKSVDDRNSVFDEANKIANYLNEKPLKWRTAVPKGKARIVTDEERRKNCVDFLRYLRTLNIDFDRLESSHKAVILSNVWGFP